MNLSTTSPALTMSITCHSASSYLQNGLLASPIASVKSVLPHLARLLEILAEILDALAPDEFLVLATAVDEVVNLRGRAVIHCAGEAPALDIEHKILAHDGEANQSKVCSSCHC